MTAPATQDYGYAHRGTVTGPSELDGYHMVRCTAINPARPVGPYPSTVPELEVGDRVLLTQVGKSRDDLVITGRLPAVPWSEHLPIGIDDVTGLQTALDARATDTELAALGTSTNLNFLAVNDKNDEQDSRLITLEAADTASDGRLDALEAADVALDGRLDTAEAALAANTSGIAANGTAIAALQDADTQFNTYSAFNQQHDVDVYGDQISPFPRIFIGAVRTITSNVAFAFRTRTRRTGNITQLRVIVGTAGVGAGTTTAALYKSATGSGAYSLVSQATHALTATGEVNFALGASPITAGDYLLLVVRASGYSTFPQIGTPNNQVRNGAHNPSTARATWGLKTVAGTLPATMDIADGSWNLTDPTAWWVALA